jgi:aryl-alcohol dehydrogenase-like predicted oxidoreductase
MGAWVTVGDQIPEKTAIQLIHTDYEAGINFFDNADVYANGLAETVMGKAIKYQLILSYQYGCYLSVPAHKALHAF